MRPTSRELRPTSRELSAQLLHSSSPRECDRERDEVVERSPSALALSQSYESGINTCNHINIHTYTHNPIRHKAHYTVKIIHPLGKC